MTERHYRQALENTRPKCLRWLSPADSVRDGLRQAARLARRWRAAVEAWEKIAPPELVEATRVVGVDGDALLVYAAAPAARYALRCRAEHLAAQLRRLVRGVTRLRVVETDNPGATGETCGDASG